MLGKKRETATYQANSLNPLQDNFISYSDPCKWLREHNLTQEKLGLLLGRTRPTIRKYVQERLWTLADVAKIATTLDLPFSEVACKLACIHEDSYFEESVDKRVRERFEECISAVIQGLEERYL